MNCTAKVGKLIVYKLWIVKNSMRGYTFAYPNIYANTVNVNRLNGPITKQYPPAHCLRNVHQRLKI